ncbi:hypothetical protein N7478_001663 [Penicillium angulare]|uniref:uncharacterized protein n=1 Tax=Penicillium angulare TaxID=116970 RepID=UPI00253F8DB5|nr:uncharacterized protein N7478_001663 [Penicillium angulare]KAJ5288633.1 hypothetical protein N7478_001663 [Penicillium angulare]
MNLVDQKRESPGTVHLVDIDGDIHAKKLNINVCNGIVLTPTPSADPNDPLNWSKSRKWLATTCVLLFTWSICVSSSACYSVFVPINAESGISFDNLNEGTGYMYLLFGWGLLFWQPLALTYGRRGVYLSCLLGTCLMNVWAGYATTNETWIATRVLIGFFGAPSEALAEVSMTDLWFTHQRGTYIGLYAMALYGGQWGAVPAGFINDTMGWPWVLFFCAILNGLAFLVCFFFMEETMYHRQVLPIQQINNEIEVAATPTAGEDNKSEKDQSTITRQLSQAVVESYLTKTYWQKLMPFTPLNGRRNTFLEMMYMPLRMFRFPSIVFAGFSYGCFLNWYAMVNAVNSAAFTALPYNWTAANVGLSYIAEIVGTYFAGFIAGRLADRLSIRLAKSNNGVMEPESRLWMFVSLAILAPLGLIIYGVGAAQGWNYWALLIGMVAIGFVGPAAGSLTITYVVDSFHELSGEGLIAVVLIRNTLNFGFNYGVTPWVDSMGMQNSFITAGLVAFVTTLVFVPFIIWGKRMRMWGAPAYWRLVERSVAV